MDYKLAKKLKDAGFPQKQEVCTGCVDSNGIESKYFQPFVKEGLEDDYAYLPSLQGLIEACGDGFFRLTKHQGFWSASIPQDHKGVAWAAWEKTPEEALANLWLELQEHKN